jgi:hypothetical protein
MKLHFDPIVFTVRVFLDDAAVLGTDRYDAVFTVTKMEDKVFISGYHGSYSPEVRRQIKQWCKAMGITGVRFSTVATDHDVLIE